MNLILSPPPKKAIGITMGVILSLGIGVILVNNILLQKPKKEEQAIKLNVFALQSKIKNIKQHLNKLHGNLKVKLNESKQNKQITHQDYLEQFIRLTERYVFNSPVISDLETYEAIAEKIVRDKNYKDALPELIKIKDGYQQLISYLAESQSGLNSQCGKLPQSSLRSQNTHTLAPSKELGQTIQTVPTETKDPREVDLIKTYQEAICFFKTIEIRLHYLRKYAGKLVIIPAGTFKMGSNNGDSNEKPVHTVHVRSFKLMAKEVTFTQYDAYANATSQPQPNDEGWGRGNLPVINVNWHQARDYAAWLSKKTGQRFRLPSEAEWEYAARAGNNNNYSWGDKINCSQARYGHDNGDCGNDHKTISVGSFSPNSFGLYDMHGNVMEWIQDCWNSNYNGAPNNGKDRIDGDCEKRVFRGGSWFYSPFYIRSASRNWSYASHQYFYFGFRLVQE